MSENTNRTLSPSRKYIAMELTAALLSSGEHITGDPQADAERAVQLLAHVEEALRRRRSQDQPPG